MYKAMIKKSKNKKGFTLVELIVVMAILAILAAILIPSVGGMIRRSNEAVDLATARNLYMAGTMVGTNGLGFSKTDSTNTGGRIPAGNTTTEAEQVVIDFLGNEWPKSKATKEGFSLVVSQPGNGDPFVVTVSRGSKKYIPNESKFSS